MENESDERTARADAKAAKARAKALRPWWKRKRILLPAAVLVIIVIAAISSGGTEDDEPVAGNGAASEGSSDQSPTDGRDSHYSVGETATTSGLAVTLHEVTDPFEASNEFITAAEGERWVAADLNFENTGSEEQSFSSLMGLELFDSEGRAWSVTITGENVPGVDGTMQPGESRRGTAVFAVPAEAELSHLIVKGSITATGARFNID